MGKAVSKEIEKLCENKQTKQKTKTKKTGNMIQA